MIIDLVIGLSSLSIISFGQTWIKFFISSSKLVIIFFDSMELVSVAGMPSGLSFGCDITNCVLPGNTLTCAYVNGTTNDAVGVYPITILVNVYTHGTLDLGFIQYPYSTDLYSALGTYENVPGYKIIVSSGNPSSFKS